MYTAIIKRGITKAKRQIIQPQTISAQPFQSYFLNRTLTYEFLTTFKPPTELYPHEITTPASLLRKSAIHLLPTEIPEINKRQKISALTRILEERYQKAYDKCKSPKEIFHLDRRIKAEIRSQLALVGTLSGRYKHLFRFKSILEQNRERTLNEYEKKGVKVESLGQQIFPMGEVWLPTRQDYLKPYQKLLSQQTFKIAPNVLDLGCGSGILSFLFAKACHRAKIIGVDSNPAAVRTLAVNAARLGMNGVSSFQFDVTRIKDFGMLAGQAGAPSEYDWILLNPPWLRVSLLAGDGRLGQGVYDEGGRMLASSLSLMRQKLKKDGKGVVIYSDLSDILGLGGKAVEELCGQNGLIIQDRWEEPFANKMGKKSALAQFKNQSKIITYLLRRSV